MEQAGLVIRMPANWRMNRPSRPRVEATVGSTSPSVLGLDALLDFQVGVSLDGDALTDKEIKELLASTDGLALVRGKWVEVNRERLQAGRTYSPPRMGGASSISAASSLDVGVARGRPTFRRLRRSLGATGRLFGAASTSSWRRLGTTAFRVDRYRRRSKSM